MDKIPLEIYHLIIHQILDNNPAPLESANEADQCLCTDDELPRTEDEKASSPPSDDAASPPGINGTQGQFETLKSLRLCSKRLACRTAEFLFEETWVRFTEESYDRLEAISQHDTYRNYVRKLIIEPKTIRGSLLQRDEFEAWLRGSRRFIEDEYFWGVCNLGEPLRFLTLPDTVKLTPAVIDFHYGCYSSLYARQRNLLIETEGMLQGAIGRFTHLNRLECMPRWYQWNWACRKRAEKSDTDEIAIDREWKLGARGRMLELDQSVIILRAVARGKHISGLSIDVGPLFAELDVMAIEIEDSEKRAEMHKLMADTKELIVHFRSTGVGEPRDFIHSGRCAKFLGLTSEASNLTCDFREVSDLFVPLAHVFGNVTWPHLTSLSLLFFSEVNSGQLINVLSRHKSSLQNLTLSDGWMFHGSWYEIFANLRGGVLKRIAVKRLTEKHCKSLSDDEYITLVSTFGESSDLYNSEINS